MGHKQYRLIKQEVKPKKTIELVPRTLWPDKRLEGALHSYRLRVRCVGHSIELYVNDQPAGNILDNSFSGGITGMILTEKGHEALTILWWKKFDDLSY